MKLEAVTTLALDQYSLNSCHSPIRTQRSQLTVRFACEQATHSHGGVLGRREVLERSPNLLARGTQSPLRRGVRVIRRAKCIISALRQRQLSLSEAGKRARRVVFGGDSKVRASLVRPWNRKAVEVVYDRPCSKNRSTVGAGRTAAAPIWRRNPSWSHEFQPCTTRPPVI